MRLDIPVPNESDLFIFTSAALRGRGISPGDREWSAAVGRGDILPLAVESEDAANVRVVVNEPLDAAEQAEWVGVVRSGLRVPDGTLLMAGGVACVLEKDDWAQEDAQMVPIPPGDYTATLYCYASAPNGRWCVDEAGGDEPLGAWCRRSDPDQDFPAWLHNLCLDDPSLDPGHRARWKRETERTGAVVDFLLHLQTAGQPLAIAACDEEGVFQAGECRRPDPFPRGIPVAGSSEEEAAPVLPPARVPSPSPAPAGDLAPLVGGPVGVPVGKLARVAHLAWSCQFYAHPALQVTWPGKAPKFEEVEEATIRTKGNATNIIFADQGQPSGALLPLQAVAKQLAGAPDGTVIDLSTARPRGKDKQGVHRYRGVVQGGVWQIEAASPAVDAAVLTEALTLVEALENGRKLMARDEDEAARIEARVTDVLADYFGSNGLQRTGTEVALKRRDPNLFPHIVARVFWMRYASIWPLQDEDSAG